MALQRLYNEIRPLGLQTHLRMSKELVILAPLSKIIEHTNLLIKYFNNDITLKGYTNKKFLPKNTKKKYIMRQMAQNEKFLLKNTKKKYIMRQMAHFILIKFE